MAFDNSYVSSNAQQAEQQPCEFETLLIEISPGHFQGSFKIDGKIITVIEDGKTAEETHIQVLLAVQKYFRNSSPSKQ